MAQTHLDFNQALPPIDVSKDDLLGQIEQARSVALKNMSEKEVYLQQVHKKRKQFHAQLTHLLSTLEKTNNDLRTAVTENRDLKVQNTSLSQKNAQLERELTAFKLRVTRNEAEEEAELRLVEKERQKAEKWEQQCRRKDEKIAKLMDLLGG
ncbi:hypothetical protein L596_026837 [Steinernema carpocapsae]|uniref:Uncharacterized protein n=1 Tax=Steinernema carpocapsae TaxID=34508 RepID=A0A4U5M2L1_STECR|nr:hypothetical protein L596_026837 [Steinernema carpocapsae]